MRENEQKRDMAAIITHGLSLTSGSDSKFTMSSMHRVSCLECDDFSP